MEGYWVVEFENGEVEIMTEQVHGEFDIGMYGRKRLPKKETHFASYEEASKLFPNAPVSY